MDYFRSEAKVELGFLLSLKDESFKCCLSDGDGCGVVFQRLLGVPLSP